MREGQEGVFFFFLISINAFNNFLYPLAVLYNDDTIDFFFFFFFGYIPKTKTVCMRCIMISDKSSMTNIKPHTYYFYTSPWKDMFGESLKFRHRTSEFSQIIPFLIMSHNS